MDEGDTPLIRNPEEASVAVHTAQIALSDPYTATIGIATWAQMSLDAYDSTGIQSDKIVLLQDLMRMIDEYENMYMASHMKLGDMYEVLLAIRARREQM